MIQLSAKPKEARTGADISGQGLYHFHRSDRVGGSSDPWLWANIPDETESVLVLMLWENDRLKFDGFIDYDFFQSDAERVTFINQWFHDREIEPLPEEKSADELPQTGDPEPSAQDAPSVEGGDSPEPEQSGV